MKSEIGDEDDDGMSQELAPLVLPLFLLRIGESKTRVVHLGTHGEEVEKVHYALLSTAWEKVLRVSMSSSIFFFELPK